MTLLNSTLRTKSQALLKALRDDPELLVQIRPPREITELKMKPKAGVKIRGPKRGFSRPVDFEAVDLKTDLDRAVKTNDIGLMATSYYALAYLLSY